METQGSMERTSWSMPISGPNGSGTLRYQYDSVGGNIRFGGEVEFGGKTIQLGSCGSVSAKDVPSPEESDPEQENADPLVCHRAAICCQKIQKLGLEDTEDPGQTCRDLFKGDDKEACAAALDDYRRFGELHDVECE